MIAVPKMSGLDVDHAVMELQAWRDGERGRRLTWAVLEKSTGFTRQSLSSKEAIKKAYDDAKEALSKDAKPRKPKGDDFLEDRIESLKRELARYKSLEDGWLERWAQIAFHLRGAGLSIDQFDKPLPQAKRT